MIIHASDKNWVTSAEFLEAQMSDPDMRLMIFSGIAAPNINVDDDEDILQGEVIIKLGQSVSAIHKAVAQVGLASIRNDESAFVYATEAVGLERDKTTSELQLRVKTAVLGDESALHRFSYQVVAHVTKEVSQILGSISVPKVLLDLTNRTLAEVATFFRVTANLREEIEPQPGDNPLFPQERFIPVATGTLVNVSGAGDDGFVEYVIDGCPFHTSLYVRVEVSTKLENLEAQQVTGPRPVHLTSVTPIAGGVNFKVVRLPLR